MSWVDKQAIMEGKQFPPLQASLYLQGSMTIHPQNPKEPSKVYLQPPKCRVMNVANRLPERYRLKQKKVAQSYLRAVSKFQKGDQSRTNPSPSPSSAMLSPIPSQMQPLNAVINYNEDLYGIGNEPEQVQHDHDIEAGVEHVQEMHEKVNQEQNPAAEKELPPAIKRAQTIYAPTPSIKTQNGNIKR